MTRIRRRAGVPAFPRVAAAVLLAATPPAAVLLAATPARAADVFVEVTPSTVEPGRLVGIRASCPTNTAPGTVTSEAFGRVTVRPQYNLLTAAATVRDDARARGYRVRLACPDGRVATTVLHVVGAVRPSRGPATGFGGAAPDGSGRLLVAGGLASIAAGVALALLGWRRRA